MLDFVYSDGGRNKYFKGSAEDCCTRAICNAVGKDYKEVYDALQKLEKTMKVGKHERRGSARSGVRIRVVKHYIENVLGWTHHSVMSKGSGVTMHLVNDELPMGTLIVDISKHLTCVKDKVIYDTYNCSTKMYYDRFEGKYKVNNRRAVYNYWTAPTENELKAREETQRQIQEYKDFVEKEKLALASRRLDVKLHNDKIKKQYASKIRKAKALVRKLERERDKQLLAMPKAEKNTWANYCCAGK